MEIKRFLHRIKKERSAYIFILPAFLIITLFIFTPLVQGIRLSFFEADLKSRTWVGLQNFSELLQDPFFWMELKNSLLIAAILLPVTIGFSLLAATLILQFNRTMQTIFRSSFYLPTVTSGVVISMVWIWLLNPSYGLFNYFLSLVGLGPVMWLGQPDTARLAVAMLVFSGAVGVNIILYIAALSAIPKTIYEGAMIDGANAWQKFFKITIPLVMPTTLYILVMTTIGAFQIWETIYILTAGGPAYATTTISFRIYQLGFQYFRFGQASAQGVVLLFIVFTVAAVQFRYLRRKLEF